MSQLSLNGHQLVVPCRPVALHKWLLVGNQLVDSEGNLLETIDCKPNWQYTDSKPCAMLAQQTLDHNHSVLIFCCSKQARYHTLTSQLMHVCRRCSHAVSTAPAVVVRFPVLQKFGFDLAVKVM